MGKGYAEGPAAEGAEAARERGDHLARPAAAIMRRIVLGSTKDDPSQHVLGYADEIDADQLFASGKAWGIKIVNAVE
ncbi:MAG: hypothetical protein E6J45_13435 [Chloroflexi bacterium]|nr:MAG: hypothetical protein E6J45_13435 [Chloroflexota bacterium]